MNAPHALFPQKPFLLVISCVQLKEATLLGTGTRTSVPRVRRRHTTLYLVA